MESKCTPKIGERKCVAGCHDIALKKFPRMTPKVTSTANARRFPKCMKSWFVFEKYLNFEKHKVCSICKVCIEYATQLMSEGPSKKSKTSFSTAYQRSDQISESVRQFASDIENDLLTHEEICYIAKVIGKKTRACFETAASGVSVVDKREFLKGKTYSKEWSHHENQIYWYFLEGIYNYRNLSEQKQCHVQRCFQKSFEIICLAMNKRFISPLALAENLVLYYYSGSKTACQIFGRTQACGQYDYLLKSINEISGLSPSFPKGDISVVFDSQQIIGREYRVTAGGNQKTSTVTSLAVFVDDTDFNLHTNVNVPTMLQFPIENIKEMWRKYSAYSDICNNIHRESREQWLADRLRIVIEDVKNPKTTYKNLTISHYQGGLEYQRVPCVATTGRAYDMENILVNPNSYANIRKVMDEILRLSEESCSERKWILLYCDGLPYTIASKIISSTYECTVCKYSGNNNDLLHHTCNADKGSTFDRKYRKIILRPGAGHYEINFVRSIFQTYFDIIIKPIAEMLGYKTPKALDYCKRANDHHKSWQILQIVLCSLTDAIFLIYIETLTEYNNASVESFGEWIENQNRPCITMASDFICNFLHPLFLFRESIRQCNDEISAAAIQKLSSIFFGFNHPKYREITATDCFYLLSLNEVGTKLIKQNSLRMKSSKFGQGFDFLLEERNAQQKRWTVSDGVPTDKQWSRASASLNFLETIRGEVFGNLDLTTEENHQKNVDLRVEYYNAKIYFIDFLRRSGNELTTFTNPPQNLPQKFLNCSFVCQENREKYFRAFLKGEKCALVTVETVEMALLATDTIVSRIRKRIKQLPQFLKSYYQGLLSNCKMRTEYLDTLTLVEDEIQDIEYRFSFD